MADTSVKKNSYIELLRFIFCLIIVIHHSGFVSADGSTFFGSGALVADAFFMITGYFTIRHIEKEGEVTDKMAYAMKYTVKKLLRVLPYAAIGTFIAYVLIIVQKPADAPFMDYIITLQNMPFELILAPMTGVINTDLSTYHNAPLWFLSSMLIGLPWVIYLALRFRDVFKNYLVWFVPAFLEAWMVVTYGGACPWQQYSGILYSGVIRGFAGMMLGCSIYYASNALSRRCAGMKSITKTALTILEVLLLVFTIYYMHRELTGYDEVFTLYVIGIVLTFAFSGVTFTSSVKGSFFAKLGSITMPIYCMHWGVFQWVGAYLGHLGYPLCVGITLAICIVLSIVSMYIINRLNCNRN